MEVLKSLAIVLESESFNSILSYILSHTYLCFYSVSAEKERNICIALSGSLTPFQAINFGVKENKICFKNLVTTICLTCH